MAAGAVSLKLPNFLTTSQDVTKGADQAKYLSVVTNKLTSYRVYIGKSILFQVLSTGAFMLKALMERTY